MENDTHAASSKNSGSLSDSTRQVYRASWRDFVEWCQSEGVPALPADPEAIATFLRERAHLALSTLQGRISAIRHYHRDAGVDDPTTSLVVQDLWYTLSEEKRSAAGRRSGAETAAGRSEPPFPPRQMLEDGVRLLPEHFRRAFEELEEKASWKTPSPDGETGDGRSPAEEEPPDTAVSTLEDRQEALETWKDPYLRDDRAATARLTSDQRRLLPEVTYDLPTLRDRALLLLMAAGGVRRSEVARLDVSDVFTEDPEVLCVGLRKKNGMPKRLLRAPIAEELRYCTARAVAAWILVAGLTDGPLFRSFDAHENLKRTRIALSSINYVLEQRAREAGFDSNDWTTSRLRKEPSDA